MAMTVFGYSTSLLRIKIDYKVQNQVKELLTMLVELSLCVIIVIFLFDYAVLILLDVF